MQSGNGIGLAAIYRLLTEAAAKVNAHDRRFDEIGSQLGEHSAKLNELIKTINEHMRQFATLTTIVNSHSRRLDDLAGGLDELRRSVDDYHHAVIGHGIAITDFGRRVDRVETHLALGPLPPSR